MASNISGDPLAQALLMSGGNPDAVTALLGAQRNQQLSQALMQQALIGPNAPTPVSGGKYTVAPRMSAISALAPLVQAYAGNKLNDKAMKAYAGVGSGLDPQRFSPGGDLAIAGVAPQAAMRAYLADPAGYAKLQMGTPEQQNQRFAASGFRQPQGETPTAEQIAAATANKGATQGARQGEDLHNFLTNQDIRNPQVPVGTVVNRDPQGNPVSVTQLPGVTGAQAASTGAETAAREANTPRLIPQGGGKETFGLPNVNFPGAQPSPASGGVPNWFPRQQSPQSQPPAAQTPAAPSAPQGSMWNSVPKLNIPNTPGQTTDALHMGILHNAVAKDSELTNQYSQQARTADARLAFNNEALKVLNSSVTGPTSDTVTKLSALAAQYGIKNAPFLPTAAQAANTQELKKFLLQNPLQNLKPTFGGRPAASEFQILANDASPSTHMLNGAIARLVQMDSTRAAYDKQQANDYGRYTQAGGDPRQYEQWYAAHKPLGTAFLKADTPPQALERLKQHPELATDFKQRFGWAPGPDD